MAYADLGGLGSKQGAPAFYDWGMPSLMPAVLPWLAILALLMLKPNRCASAWWIWVPLAVVAWLASAVPPALEFIVSQAPDFSPQLIGALAFGVAAVWLVSSYLGWKRRMLAFLGMLLAQVGFSVLAYAATSESEDKWLDLLQGGIPLVLSILVISTALSLAGLACRGRYSWLRLSLWLIAALVVVWMVVILPLFFIFAMVARGGDVLLAMMLVSVPTAAVITFGVLLPFLMLSFANRFYRERLKGLLHLGAAAPPAVISPPMPAVPAAA